MPRTISSSRLRPLSAPARKVGRFALLLALVALAAAGARAQTFAPLQKLAGTTVGVATGDLNGDGRPDVVTTDPGGSSGGSFTVRLGNGDGTFRPRQDFAAPSGVNIAVVADLNGDGKQDVVVLAGFNSSSSGALVSAALGNGDGTFRPRADFPVPHATSHGLAVADLNGDSKPDLVALSHDTLSVLDGNGDGTFDTARTFPAGFASSALAVGDLNGDGKQDVVVAGARLQGGGVSRVSVMLGSGDGNLGAPADFDCGPGPTTVVARDVNGDGKLDLITGNQFGESVSVLRGNGDGTFQPKVDSAARVFGDTQSLQIADLDADGKQDVVTTYFEGFSVARGNGDGTFGPPKTFGAPEAASRQLAVADLDGDAKPDLVGGDFNGDSVNILLNRTGPRSISGRLTDDSGAPLASAFVTLTGPDVSRTDVPTDADGRYSHSGLAAGRDYTVTPVKLNYSFAPASRTFEDLASDETADFTGTLRRFRIAGTVRTSMGTPVRGVVLTLGGDATGTTTTAADGTYSFTGLAAGGDYTVTAAAPPRLAFALNRLHFNDLSSDRVGNFLAFAQTFTIRGTVTDTVRGGGIGGVMVTLSGSRTVVVQTSFDGTYSFPGLPIGGDYTVTVSQRFTGPPFFSNQRLLAPTSVRVPDLESDVTINFPGATLSAGVGSAPRRVVAADFNGDGRLDVATANAAFGGEAASVSVLLGRGDGTFNPETRIATAEVPAELIAADFNGDGKPDLAVGSANRGDVRVLLGAGDGTFPTRATYDVQNFMNSMAAADFNGDGRPDLATAGLTFNAPISQTPGVRMLINQGNGTFALGATVTLAATPFVVRAGDLNGDGKADLVVGGDASTIVVRLGNGNGTFGPAITFTFTTVVNPSRLALGDFNSDGKLDVLAVNIALSSNNLHVLLGNGDGTLRQARVLSGKTGPLVVRDFDGDGKLDIVSAPFIANGNQMVAFLGNGDGSFRPAPTTQIFDDPEAMAAGDFNGDGRPDLAIARSRQGQATIPRNLDVWLNLLNRPSVEFSADAYGASEVDGRRVITVTRTGDLSGAASVDYASSNVSATDRGDYIAAVGTLRFAPGEASKTFTVFITNDALVEGSEQFGVSLSAPVGVSLGGRTQAVVNIASDDTAPPTAANNPIDNAAFFVRQHYRDFLSREPDQAGLDFWTGQFAACGPDAQCLAARRADVSAAFFLSVEFQGTGYQVFRVYKASFTPDNARPRGLPRYLEFLRDSQAVGRGVVVGQPGWEELLRENTLDFARRWVETAEFVSLFPQSMSAGQFVDKLFAGSEVTPTAQERAAAVAAFGAGATEGRARALLSVTGSRSVYNRQYNAAFVLMQYIGYLRRNPNDLQDTDYVGFDFWLGKLNEFSRPGEDVTDERIALGRVRRAEMIQAFITSGEYRGRFGLP